ncbi:MAG: hypothetical protein WCL00_01590 [Bacteroidota bacterium]
MTRKKAVLAKSTGETYPGENTIARKFIGEVSQEQIDFWKKQFGGCSQITVKDHVCYLKPADKAVLSYALSMIKVRVDDPSKAGEVGVERIIQLGEVVLQNCWLDGSEAIKNIPNLWMSAAVAAGDMVEIVEAELKNL